MNIIEIENIINHFLNIVDPIDRVRNTMVTFTDDKYITGVMDCNEGQKIFIIDSNTKRLISLE